VADALYDFFAQELLLTFEVSRREQLFELAAAPTITPALMEALYGAASAEVLTEASRTGVVAVSGSDIVMHPLLRRFLLTKFRELPDDQRQRVITVVFEFLLEQRAWDDAFSMIELFELRSLIDRLVSAGLSEMLHAGRIPTLKRWLGYAQRVSGGGPSAGVLAAELAFRQGSHALAEARAAQAAAQLQADDHLLRQRAWLRAGQAAYFGERYDEALAYLERSLCSGRDPKLEREARWVGFIASLDGERNDALRRLAQFESLLEHNVDDAVRMSNARLLVATRRGGITEAVTSEAQTAHLVSHASDPMIRSAFLNIYAWALAMNGRYDAAAAVVDEERREAEAHHLSFVLPHADLVGAMCAVGFRDVALATSLIVDVQRAAKQHDDLFLALSATAVRGRLAIAQASPDGALAETGVPDFAPRARARSAWYECLSIRAIALASAGFGKDARQLAHELLHLTSHAEVRASSVLAIAICELTENGGDEATRSALEVIEELGEFDSLVTAYRAFPPLIGAVARVGRGRLIADVAARASDHQLVQRYGLLRDHPLATKSRLSPREEQVLDLLASGRTNDEIARVLFISSVTVKAHLRHIYEKLGVRNRVEAARLARQRQPAA
jgi:DNA-binding CsgD family transcriptional regulator